MDLTKIGTTADSRKTGDHKTGTNAGTQRKTSTEEETTASGTEPEAEEKTPYKTAFYCLLIVFALALLFYIGVSFFTHKSATQLAFYEELASQTTERAFDAAPADDQIEKINVNTATAEELMRLPGIGEARAQAIVAFREEYGLLTDYNDLLKIDGIGNGILEEIVPYIVFRDPQ